MGSEAVSSPSELGCTSKDLKETDTSKTAAKLARRPSLFSYIRGSYRNGDFSVDLVVSIFRCHLLGCHRDGKQLQETAHNESWAGGVGGWPVGDKQTLSRGGSLRLGALQ